MELEQQDRYLWDHLIGHLSEAAQPGEAETMATDLRWVAARLERSGPAAPAADLAAVGTPRAAPLREVLARTAHLLAPAHPAAAIVDALCSGSPTIRNGALKPPPCKTSGISPGLSAVCRWPLPELPHPSTLRVLSGQHGEPFSLTIAPDGSFLAASSGREVRIWDLAAAEKARSVLDPGGYQFKLAIAPDGTWLATASGRKVWIWDELDPSRSAYGHVGRASCRYRITDPRGDPGRASHCRNAASR